jgi:hypothetical protein
MRAPFVFSTTNWKMVLMNKWLKRLLYLLFTLFWLVVMLFPTFAFILMQNEQIEIGATRIFLLNTEDASGVGFQTQRPANTDDDVQCERGNIRYLMWQSDGTNENASYCACEDGSERLREGRWCRLPD